MSIHVPPGSVVDTTADPGWEPVTVTAHLVEPIVRLDHPMCLDGPLSWCAYLAATAAGHDLEPITTQWAPDIALPLAQWTAPAPIADLDPRMYAADGTSVWGWACSRAHYDTTAHTATQVRRKPATAQMARYTRERKVHMGLGPHKARDTIYPATQVNTVTWHALAQPDRLTELLAHLTHLGALTRHGHGRIQQVTVEPGPVDGWRDRPWPDSAGRPGMAIRAPYHHHTRRMACRA